MSGFAATVLAAGMLVSDPAAAAAPESPTAAETAPAVESSSAAEAEAPAPEAATVAESAAATTPRSVVIYNAGGPSGLLLRTPSTALLGGVGFFMVIAERKEFVRDHEIQDPSGEIARGVAEAIAKARAVKAAASPRPIGDMGRPGPEVAYVVEVQPLSTVVSYYSFGWMNYYANYKARLRVLDPATDKVLLKASCSVETPREGAPSHEQLMVNRAAGLKEMLGRVGELCLEELALKLPKLKA